MIKGGNLVALALCCTVALTGSLVPNFKPVQPQNPVSGGGDRGIILHTLELVDATGNGFQFNLFKHDLDAPAKAVAAFCNRATYACMRIWTRTHLHTHARAHLGR